MNTALIMLAVYMIVTIGITIYFSRKKQDTKSFMVAKSSLGVGLIIPLLFSEMIAGSGTIGNAASAFNQGLSAVWMNWGMVLGVILFLVLALKFYKAMNSEKGVFSVPEAYQYIFDKKCRMVMLVVIIIVYAILYSTQPVAAAAIIAPALGANQTLVTWMITAVFVLVTLGGGMRGIAWMNVVHAVVMFAGMFLVAYKSVQYAGGMEALHALLPATYFSFTQPDIFTTIANAFGTGISMLAAATVVVVAFGAKNMKTAKTGMLISALLILPFALMPALVGMCAKIVLPDVSANSALFSMANHLGGLYGGIASMAIIAAIWSTAPALLLVVSTTLTRDFYRVVKPAATDGQQLFFSKLAIVIIAVVATFFGLNAGSILDQMYGAFQIRSIVAIVLVIALRWPRVTTTAAFWSMLIGGGTAAGWFVAGNPFGVSCLWPAAGISLLILIPLTLMSKEKVSPGYQLYQNAVKSMLEKDRTEQESRQGIRQGATVNTSDEI